MSIDWTPFVDLVRSHQRFLIVTHVRPDGDALGSAVGLACAIRQLDKSVRVTVDSDLGPRYEFANKPTTPIERFREPGDNFCNVDAIIVVDTGTWGQLGKFGSFMRSMTCAKAVIDHHRTQDDLGALRFVDTSAEAAGRLVHDATLALGVPVTTEAANNLFLALATDTGWFRHSSVEPRTFALAEELVRAGAKPTDLYDAVYGNNTLARMRLVGRALERMKCEAGGRIAYTDVHWSDYAETGAVPTDTEDLINYPRAVVGVDIALVFIEQRDGSTKVSFRGNATHDVGRLAEQFGGGGHRMASGATVVRPLAETRTAVLKAAAASLSP
jgi:bifunctional oligoribonuclease and PAP phosphatase NrnA